jgi:hypothetical protein
MTMAVDGWNYSLEDADEDPEKRHVFEAEAAYNAELEEYYNITFHKTRLDPGGTILV